MIKYVFVVDIDNNIDIDTNFDKRENFNDANFNIIVV